MFFCQELWLGALPPLLWFLSRITAGGIASSVKSYGVGLVAGVNALGSGQKHFQNKPLVLGSAAQHGPIMFGLAKLDPKHFKTGRGWVWLGNRINVLRSGSAATSKDIIICIINILKFIIINIKILLFVL